MRDTSDLVNEVSSTFKKRTFEQTAYAGYLLALQGNNLEVTTERLTPYTNALNEASLALWAALWKAYNAGLCKRPTPPKAPQVRFNKAIKCDGRCQNANPWGECECGCGGANHGIGSESFKFRGVISGVAK